MIFFQISVHKEKKKIKTKREIAKNIEEILNTLKSLNISIPKENCYFYFIVQMVSSKKMNYLNSKEIYEYIEIDVQNDQFWIHDKLSNNLPLKKNARIQFQFEFLQSLTQQNTNFYQFYIETINNHGKYLQSKTNREKMENQCLSQKENVNCLRNKLRLTIILIIPCLNQLKILQMIMKRILA